MGFHLSPVSFHLGPVGFYLGPVGFHLGPVRFLLRPCTNMVSGFSIVYNCTNHKNHLLLGVNAWWKLKRLYFRFRAVNLKYFLLKTLYVVVLLNWNYFRVHFFFIKWFYTFSRCNYLLSVIAFHTRLKNLFMKHCLN